MVGHSRHIANSSPRLFILLFAFPIAAVLGCNSVPIVLPRSDPFLYLVLHQRTFVSPQQRALLLTVGSPTNSDYRLADMFEMRRRSDGAPFVWRDLGQRGQAPVDASNASLTDGNYGLMDSASAGSLGATDIGFGTGYDLMIRTGGVTINGTVTVPAAFGLVLQSDGAKRVVCWPRVNGALSYSVEIGGVTAPHFQDDTLIEMPALPSVGADVVVKALDTNLTRYVRDGRTIRAGIDAGYGVVGALSIASLHVLP